MPEYRINDSRIADEVRFRANGGLVRQMPECKLKCRKTTENAPELAPQEKASVVDAAWAPAKWCWEWKFVHSRCQERPGTVSGRVESARLSTGWGKAGCSDVTWLINLACAEPTHTAISPKAGQSGPWLGGGPVRLKTHWWKGGTHGEPEKSYPKP